MSVAATSFRLREPAGAQLRSRRVTERCFRSSGSEKILDARHYRCGLSKLAFPNGHYLPSQLFQLGLLATVSNDRGATFVAPEFRIGRRRDPAPFALMRMPKTAVYKYCLATSSEGDVRTARKGRHINEVSVPESMQQSSKTHFGSGVLALYCPHVFTALGRSEHVHKATQYARVGSARCSVVSAKDCRIPPWPTMGGKPTLPVTDAGSIGSDGVVDLSTLRI
jgi:hypothetical protein